MFIFYWLQKKPMKITPYRKLFGNILSSLSRVLLLNIYLYQWVQISLHDFYSVFRNDGLIFNILAFCKWQCILLVLYCIPAAWKKTPWEMQSQFTAANTSLSKQFTPIAHTCLSNSDTTSLCLCEGSDMIHNPFQEYFAFISYKIRMKTS